MAKDKGCPAQRRPVARVQHQRLYWFQKALPFLSLHFLPSNAFTEEERDCVSVPAAAKKKERVAQERLSLKERKNSWAQNPFKI